MTLKQQFVKHDPMHNKLIKLSILSTAMTRSTGAPVLYKQRQLWPAFDEKCNFVSHQALKTVDAALHRKLAVGTVAKTKNSTLKVCKKNVLMWSVLVQ